MNVLDAVVDRLCQTLLGKPHTVKLSVCCLLAGGHLLIEDLPGMGKTTLAKSLAQVFGLQFNRVQFTSDLLPSDILGVSVYNQSSSKFEFHPGPIFSEVLLADEINRSGPKTQSALLEAMEENKVTIDGQTRPLPNPFFVIASQNPSDQDGTFPLPESQLDRFLMATSIGYPTSETALALLMGDHQSTVSKPVMPKAQYIKLMSIVPLVTLSEASAKYIIRLVDQTRSHTNIDIGVSPRGSLAIAEAAKAWAILEGRKYVLPDDIQAVFSAVVAHRIKVAGRDLQYKRALCEQILIDTVVL